MGGFFFLEGGGGGGGGGFYPLNTLDKMLAKCSMFGGIFGWIFVDLCENDLKITKWESSTTLTDVSTTWVEVVFSSY